VAPAIFSLIAFIVLNEVRRNAVVQSSEGVRGGKGGRPTLYTSKYYKNSNEYCAFAVFVQIGLSGQYGRFLQF
jgi:hypothetical protein